MGDLFRDLVVGESLSRPALQRWSVILVEVTGEGLGCGFGCGVGRHTTQDVEGREVNLVALDSYLFSCRQHGACFNRLDSHQIGLDRHEVDQIKELS